MSIKISLVLVVVVVVLLFFANLFFGCVSILSIEELSFFKLLRVILFLGLMAIVILLVIRTFLQKINSSYNEAIHDVAFRFKGMHGIGQADGVDFFSLSPEFLKRQKNESKKEIMELIARAEHYSRNSMDLLEEQIAALQETGAACVSVSDSIRKVYEALLDISRESVLSDKMIDEMVNQAESSEALYDDLGLKSAPGALASELKSEFKELQKQLVLLRGTIHTAEKLEDQIGLLSVKASIEAKKSKDKGSGFSAISKEIERLSGNVKALNSELGTSVSSLEKEYQDELMVHKKLSVKIEEKVTSLNSCVVALLRTARHVKDIAPQLKALVVEIQTVRGRQEESQEGVVQLTRDSQKNLIASEAVRDKVQSLNQAIKRIYAWLD